ncbi:ABC transporter permease [Paraburkholderia bannensis]|uniref:ABC transporter permease n=1 Tax=Paraburkholderia bannensis TaxID=765414 RepID=UPI002ABE2313|nr:ABC transporter permease [Paraburkholderia bannensis]
MIQYLARRLVLSLVTVVGAAVLSFFLVHLTPGSPGQLILGSGASQEQIDAMNDKIGWNESLVSQLTHYLAGAVQGDLGESIIDGHAIGPDLCARLQITGTIALLATLVSAVFGVLVGVVCAVRGGVTDRLVNAANAMALSAPPFWIGVVLVYLLAVETGLLPATGYVSPADGLRGWLASITLPVVALAIPGIAIVARTARVSTIQSLAQPHIQMLRSMGTPPWRVLFVHTLRSASVPVVSVLGMQFVAVFTGSIIIEGLFGLPGLGQAASTAVTYHDFPAVEGVVIVASLVVVMVNLVLDALVVLLDPRVRLA